MCRDTLFRDPLVDGHEAQADFEAEIQAEADSGLPPICPLCRDLSQDCNCPQGKYLRTIEYKGFKFSIVEYVGFFGYINHHGTLSITPGSIPNSWTDCRFQTERAVISDIEFCIDLLLKIPF